MSKVRAQFFAWLTEILGFEGISNEVNLDQEIEEGETVRDLMNELAVTYPRFGQNVFNMRQQKLSENVCVFFNGRMLEVANGLETKLSNGDTLTFLASIEGG